MNNLQTNESSQRQGDHGQQDPYNLATTYLVQKPRTVQEMRNWLQKKGTEATAIDETIVLLLDAKYLDDDKYAEQFIELSVRNRPQGRILLHKRLRKRGVAEDKIRSQLDEHYSAEEEHDVCLKLAERKLAQDAADLPKQKQIALVGRFLASRGFSEGMIWEVLGDMGLTE